MCTTHAQLSKFENVDVSNVCSTQLDLNENFILSILNIFERFIINRNVCSSNFDSFPCGTVRSTHDVAIWFGHRRLLNRIEFSFKVVPFFRLLAHSQIGRCWTNNVPRLCWDIICSLLHNAINAKYWIHILVYVQCTYKDAWHFCSALYYAFWLIFPHWTTAIIITITITSIVIIIIVVIDIFNSFIQYQYVLRILFIRICSSFVFMLFSHWASFGSLL